jgi:hypothetical protein
MEKIFKGIMYFMVFLTIDIVATYGIMELAYGHERAKHYLGGYDPDQEQYYLHRKNDPKYKEELIKEIEAEWDRDWNRRIEEKHLKDSCEQYSGLQ